MYLCHTTFFQQFSIAKKQVTSKFTITIGTTTLMLVLKQLQSNKQFSALNALPLEKKLHKETQRSYKLIKIIHDCIPLHLHFNKFVLPEIRSAFI